MGSQRSQVLEGVPRGSFAELVVTHIGWEPGGGGHNPRHARETERGRPLPDCLPVTVGNRSSPHEFKAANENRGLASERGVNAGGWYASTRLSFTRGSIPEQRAAAPRTCFVRFVPTEWARSTPLSRPPIGIYSSPLLVDDSTPPRLLHRPLESDPTLQKITQPLTLILRMLWQKKKKKKSPSSLQQWLNLCCFVLLSTGGGT